MAQLIDTASLSVVHKHSPGHEGNDLPQALSARSPRSQLRLQKPINCSRSGQTYSNPTEIH